MLPILNNKCIPEKEKSTDYDCSNVYQYVKERYNIGYITNQKM